MSTLSSRNLAVVLVAATTTGILVGMTLSTSILGRRRKSRDFDDDDFDDDNDEFGMYPENDNNRNQSAAATFPSRNGRNCKQPSPSFPSELREEQLSRHTLFFGPDGMETLRHARICVVGAGGVGSHTVCSLIRSGVGYIRVIDFDQVSLSSLNRHACATLAHVGTSKTQCLVDYAQQLCPDRQYLVVEGCCEMYTAETSDRLLALPEFVDRHYSNHNHNEPNYAQPADSTKSWDWIVDAIDDVPTKAHLIYTAWKRGIRVVSCMGAGGKADFTRLHVSDLQSASRDPLATKLRQCLKQIIKQQHNQDPNTSQEVQELFQNAEQLAIVFSSEKVVQKLADLTPEQKETKKEATNSNSNHALDHQNNSGGVADEYGAVAGMRVRVLPVLGTLPAIMGQSLAAWVLTELTGQSFQPVTGERVGRNVRNKLFQKLQTREDRFLRSTLLQQQQQEEPNRSDSDPQKELSKTVEHYQKHGGLVQVQSPVLSKNNDNNESDLPKSNPVWIGPLQIDGDDVEYLLHVWRNRCAITGARLGTVLELVRWDPSQPSTCPNLILVSQHAKQKWDDAESGGRVGLSQKVRANIEARLATCRIDSQA